MSFACFWCSVNFVILVDDAYKDLLDILRIHGVRIKNAEKNIGKVCFLVYLLHMHVIHNNFSICV